MIGRVLDDRLADGGRLGHVEVGVEVHLGIGESTGERTLAGDLRRRPRSAVGRDDGGARVSWVAALVGEPGVHRGEELLHRRPDGGIVDALVGAEDDGARRPAGTEVGEVLLEHVEPVGALRVGDVVGRVVGRADGAGEAEDGDQGGEPDADGRLAVVVAPGTEAGKETRVAHRAKRCTGGSEHGDDPLVFRLSLVEDWAQPAHNPRECGADQALRWCRRGDRRRRAGRRRPGEVSGRARRARPVAGRRRAGLAHRRARSGASTSPAPPTRPCSRT